MELFTLGVDQYSQADVVSSARAWTGHNTLDGDREQYHFYPDRHDTGLKTFMGVTQNWDGPDIIDFILGSDTTHKTIAAKFIAAKMWSFFAYPDPEPDVVTSLANSFLGNDLSIHDLVRAIFMHPNFVSPKAMNGLVRTPAEWVAACMRVAGITAEDANPQWYMDDMGQQLFEPPNVSGWRPNEYWLTTSRLWARANWGRGLVWKNNDVQNRLERDYHDERPRRDPVRLRLLRHRRPVRAHAVGTRSVVDEAAHRYPRVGQLDVHQPVDAADAQPGIQPRLGARS